MVIPLTSFKNINGLRKYNSRNSERHIANLHWRHNNLFQQWNSGWRMEQYNTSVATVNSVTGLVTAVAAGTSDITYTVSTVVDHLFLHLRQ